MKNLYFEIIDEIFKDKADLFKQKLNEEANKSITVNLLKNSLDNLIKDISFNVTKSSIASLSYHYDISNIGKSKAYDLGLIYPQDEAACSTVDLIDFNEDSLIVDMCAAPGGKSICSAIKTNDKCMLISNEISHSRSMSLLSNVERMGISNIIITNKNTTELANDLKGLADYVIVDAPCSGMGMARKYPEIIESLNMNDINLCIIRQNEILENAYQILKKGGYLLYSTCTYTCQENDLMIKAFLNEHKDMILVKNKTKLLSFIDNTEGQYMALMQKTGESETNKVKYLVQSDNKIVKEFIDMQIDIQNYYLYDFKNKYYLSLKPLINLNKNVLRYGILVGELKNKTFIPAHSFYRANILKNHFRNVIEINCEDYDKYVTGLELKFDLKDGFYLITYNGYALGHGKMAKGILKNKYPKGLRKVN